MSIALEEQPGALGPSTDRWLRRYGFALVLLLYLGLALPPCFLGYGSDNDSYQVIGAGRCVWQQHLLITSRLPGYWTFEAAVYWLNRMGGPLLVNLVSLAMGAAILWRLNALRKRFPCAAVLTASLCLVLVPSFQIAASSCDDYLWSLLPLLLVFEALLDEQDPHAGAWGALVVAIRPTNAVVLVGLFAGAALARRGRLMAGGKPVPSLVRFGWCAAISVIGLLPLGISYLSFGHSFAFLHEVHAQSPMFRWTMYAGRFGFKVLMFFGPLTFFVLVAGCLRLRDRFRRMQEIPSIALPCVGVLMTNVLLFARYPLEISYLLPGALFFLVLLSCTLLPGKRPFAIALVLALLFSNVCTIVFARPDQPDRASGARLGLSFEAGPVVQDVRIRRTLVGCDSLICWKQVTGK